MSSRYNKSDIIKTNNETRRFVTTIYSAPPENLETDIYIRTTTIERLDKLAYQFYGDSEKWWLIAIANGMGKGTIIVPSNTRLRIPSAKKIEDLITNINKTR